MEIKINKEIRAYSEGIFMSLSPRQFFFSLLAVLVSVALYITLKDKVSRDILSYVIILSCVPFAFLGFFKYNGMPAEKFACEVIKDELIERRYIYFEGENIYSNILKDDKKC